MPRTPEKAKAPRLSPAERAARNQERIAKKEADLAKDKAKIEAAATRDAALAKIKSDRAKTTHTYRMAMATFQELEDEERALYQLAIAEPDAPPESPTGEA